MLLRHIQMIVLCSGLMFITQVVAQQTETTLSPQGQDSVAPRLIRINGVVKDEIGRTAAGVNVTFSVYKDEQSAVPLWTEMQNVTFDSDGHYSVFLGASSWKGVPVNLFTSGDVRWLGVKPADVVEQSRSPLAVPYAFNSGDALPPSTQIIKDIIGPGCSGNTCTSTATWPTGGFVDTNYTVTCSPDRGSSQPQTGELITLTKTTTKITVQLLGVCNGGCDSPSMTAFECIAVHD